MKFFLCVFFNLPLINQEKRKRHITLVMSEQSKYLNKNILKASKTRKIPSMMSQYGMDELSGHSLMLFRPMMSFMSGKRRKYVRKSDTNTI